MRNNVEKTPSMLDIIVTSAKNCVRSVREHSTSLMNMASMMTFANRMVELVAIMTAKDVLGLVEGRVFMTYATASLYAAIIICLRSSMANYIDTHRKQNKQN